MPSAQVLNTAIRVRGRSLRRNLTSMPSAQILNIWFAGGHSFARQDHWVVGLEIRKPPYNKLIKFGYFKRFTFILM
jgi:hypothetical protein